MSRLDLPFMVDDHLNEERLNQQMLAVAKQRHANQQAHGKAGVEYWQDGWPYYWTHHKGCMGELGLKDWMMWDDPITPHVGGDPGYDFKKMLKFGGLVHIWHLDCKCFDPEEDSRRQHTVLLRDKTTERALAKFGERFIFVWCEYSRKLDQGWPIGWLFATDIKPETRERIKGGHLIIPRGGRNGLKELRHLTRATWTNLEQTAPGPLPPHLAA